MAETPGCTCTSHGLAESYRHGLACPYAQRLPAAEQPAREVRRIVVYIARPDEPMGPKGSGWTARAYEDVEDGRHLWSSEDATTLHQALREVAEGIEADGAALRERQADAG